MEDIDFNPGTVLEALNNKVDLPSAPPRGQDEIDYVVDWQRPTEENSYTWYRKYKSGWVEQGGQIQSAGYSGSVDVSLPITMSNNRYTLIVSVVDGNDNITNTAFCLSRTTSTFRTRTGFNGGSSGSLPLCWVAQGYAA